mgnify:CR=1 FL=1
MRCQAVSSLTVILVTCNAHGTYRRLLSSFVRLLLGIVARIGAQSDQQLRLVACESSGAGGLNAKSNKKQRKKQKQEPR